MLISVQDLFKKIKAKERIIFLGDGLRNYRDLIVAKFGRNARISGEAFWYPKAGNILEIAQGLIKRKKLSDALRIKPLYLYSKECQIVKR